MRISDWSSECALPISDWPTRAARPPGGMGKSRASVMLRINTGPVAASLPLPLPEPPLPVPRHDPAPPVPSPAFFAPDELFEPVVETRRSRAAERHVGTERVSTHIPPW